MCSGKGVFVHRDSVCIAECLKLPFTEDTDVFDSVTDSSSPPGKSLTGCYITATVC